MPKVDLEAITPSNATGYPDPFHEEVQGRWWKRIAPAAGLTEIGASHVTLDPGAWSSQRHWHATEDELVVMLSGRAVLVEDDGEREVGPGDVLAWAKGVAESISRPSPRFPWSRRTLRPARGSASRCPARPAPRG